MCEASAETCDPVEGLVENKAPVEGELPDVYDVVEDRRGAV